MPISYLSALDDETGFAGEGRGRPEKAVGPSSLLLALGIVYGDLGSSPLYTLQTIVHILGGKFTPEIALGALSLIFWALIITISVKYCLREGGWIPLSFGALVFAVMTTWHSGIAALHRRNTTGSETLRAFLARITDEGVVRVPGTAIFLTRLGKITPPIIANYVHQARSLHGTVVALTVSFENVPRISPADRFQFADLGGGVWRATAHFGFVEIPDLPAVIVEARKQGLPSWDQPTYFIERYDPISRKGRSAIGRWRVALFGFMSRNSAHAVDRFRIPSDQLVEIGRRIEL